MSDKRRALNSGLKRPSFTRPKSWVLFWCSSRSTGWNPMEKRSGLVGRCLRDNRGLSQSLKEGDNRLESKKPLYRWNGVCVTVMQLSVCVFVLLPTLQHCASVSTAWGNTAFCLNPLFRNFSDCTACVEEMSCFFGLFSFSGCSL